MLKNSYQNETRDAITPLSKLSLSKIKTVKTLNTVKK